MMFLCPDCRDGDSSWYIPAGTMLSLVYSTVFAAALNKLLLTWSNKYVTGTLVIGYTPLQPVVAALLEGILLLSQVLPVCSNNADGVCLENPGFSALGASGVFAGLYILIKTEPKCENESDRSKEPNRNGVVEFDSINYNGDVEIQDSKSEDSQQIKALTMTK